MAPCKARDLTLRRLAVQASTLRSMRAAKSLLVGASGLDKPVVEFSGAILFLSLAVSSIGEQGAAHQHQPRYGGDKTHRERQTHRDLRPPLGVAQSEQRAGSTLKFLLPCRRLSSRMTRKQKFLTLISRIHVKFGIRPYHRKAVPGSWFLPLKSTEPATCRPAVVGSGVPACQALT